MYFADAQDARRFLMEFCIFCNAGLAGLLMLIFDLVPWFMLPGATALCAGVLISRRGKRQMPSLIEAGRTSTLFARGGGAQQRYFGKAALSDAIDVARAGPGLKLAAKISRGNFFIAPVLILLATAFHWGDS